MFFCEYLKKSVGSPPSGGRPVCFIISETKNANSKVWQTNYPSVHIGLTPDLNSLRWRIALRPHLTATHDYAVCFFVYILKKYGDPLKVAADLFALSSSLKLKTPIPKPGYHSTEDHKRYCNIVLESHHPPRSLHQCTR